MEENDGPGKNSVHTLKPASCMLAPPDATGFTSIALQYVQKPPVVSVLSMSYNLNLILVVHFSKLCLECDVYFWC